jgi:uncharacterized membrane protein (UPF0136 family)
MRWWLRNLAAGAAAGFAVGLVGGGTLGRVYMRLVFLAEDGALGFETAMGAIVGEFTSGGTASVYGFGAIVGLALGLAYAVTRRLLPDGLAWRTALFVTGTTAFMTGQIVRANRDDFSFLPVTLSLALTAGSVALTALPLPWLVERLAPDRPHQRGVVARGLVVAGMTAFVGFGVTGIVIAYSTPRVF